MTAFELITPWPYTFKLRKVDEDISEAVGFLCRKQGEGFGPRWSKMLYGAIPTRLSSGDARFNDQSNVTFQTYDNLHSGGFAAASGTDNTRYQWAMGVYAGDSREFCLAPEATEITGDGTSIPAGQRIMQIVPWLIPPTTAATVGAPVVMTGQLSNRGDLDTGENCYFKYTAITSGQESPASLLYTAPVTTAGNSSIVLDWPAVPGATGYKLYGFHSKTEPYSDDKLGFIRLESDDGRQTSLGLKRFEYTGDTITKGTPPAGAPGINTGPLPKLLVFTCDATKTYCYLASTSAFTTTYVAQPLAKHDVGGSPNTLFLDGTIKPNSIVQWGDELLVPTYKFGGTETVQRIFWDQSRADSGGQQKMRVSSLKVRGEMLYADGTRRLWRAIDHQMYWCADPLAGKQEWTGPMNVGARTFPIGAIRVFGGTAGDAATYVSKGDGLWRNLETDDGPGKFFERVAVLGVPAQGTGDVMVEHAGQLFISGYRDLFRHTIGVLDSAHPNKDEGLPPVLDGNINAMVSTGRHLYLLTNIYGGVRPAYMQILETKQGEVWHQVFCSDRTDGRNPGLESTSPLAIDTGCIWQGQAMTLVGLAFTDEARAYLYFGGGTTWNKLWRIPVRIGHERLRQAPGYAPIQSGRIHFPPFYGSKPAVDKTWLWAELAQSRETVPNNASVVFTGEMLHNQAATEVNEFAHITSTPATGAIPPAVNGDFSPDRIMMTAGDSTIRDWTSNGIAFDLLIQRLDGGDTPVFGAMGFSFLEKSVALSRWTYNVEIALDSKLPNGQIDPTSDTAEEALAKTRALEVFAATGGPLILTHEDGNEYMVRVDLGMISPTRWEHRLDHATPPASYVEPSTTIVQVICTELYDTGPRRPDGTWIG